MTVDRFALLMLVLTVGVSPAAVIRLPATATCEQSVITLGAVAEILAADEIEKNELGRLTLGPAPVDGQSHWIDIAEIKDRLHAAGYRLIDIEFAGARRVEVQAGEGVRPSSDAKRTPAQWRDEIERVIQASLHEGGANFSADEDVRVRVEGDRAISFLADTQPTHWELAAPKTWLPGWQMVQLEVAQDETVMKFPIRIEIAVRPPVVAARIPIGKGQVIGAEDILLVAHEAVASDEGLALDPAAVVGKEAIRDLPAGEPIQGRDLRLTPVVFRGQPINVHIVYKTAWLQKTFIAGRDAGVGEWIEVNESGRQGQSHDHQVQVTGPHTAILPMNAPASSKVRRPEPAKRAASSTPNIRPRG